MPRKPAPTDFNIDVEGIGRFTFAKRTMADEIRCQVEYASIIDGVIPTMWLQSVGGWISALRVLTVRAPEGWDIETMDPLDPETYERLRKVHAALVAKEASFRAKPGAGSEGGGQGADQDGGVLVPPALQDGSERPEVPVADAP